MSSITEQLERWMTKQYCLRQKGSADKRDKRRKKRKLVKVIVDEATVALLRFYDKQQQRDEPKPIKRKGLK